MVVARCLSDRCHFHWKGVGKISLGLPKYTLYNPTLAPNETSFQYRNNSLGTGKIDDIREP